MPETILIHSFRRGVGRSNIAANLAFLLASNGRRVGLIDTDTTAPPLHTLLGLKDKFITYTLNDYLDKTCQIEQTAHPLTGRLSPPATGKLFLIPARAERHAQHLHNGAGAEHLNRGCQRLIKKLNLDVLLIDTQPGLTEEALVSLTISETLALVLRPDQPDYQGTGVTVDVVRQMNHLSRLFLIVNETPAMFDVDQIKEELEKHFKCPVAAVLPHADELMALGNRDIFARRYPYHPFTSRLRKAADQLVKA